MRFNNTLKSEIYFSCSACLVLFVLIDGCVEPFAFQPIQLPQQSKGNCPSTAWWRHGVVHLFNNIQDDIDGGETISVTPTTNAAKTGTVNERLLAELQEATALEKSGSRSGANSVLDGNANKLTQVASFFKSSKTDAERRAAIEEARNLNGVNPITTLLGSCFALACAVGLWWLTQSLATYFALHPSDSDIYFVERVTVLSRNIIMGLSALASGFFAVTGLGILLLAIRVGFGVVTGELDPTPIASSPSTTATNRSAKIDMSNVWDMMMNKSSKKGQR